MRGVNKLISIAVLACFLVNTAMVDCAFALGTEPASVQPDKRDEICRAGLDKLAAERPIKIDLDVVIPVKPWTVADLPKGNVIMSNRELPSDPSCAPFNAAPMIHGKKILIVTLKIEDMTIIKPALYELSAESLGNSLSHIMLDPGDLDSFDHIAAKLQTVEKDADIILFPNASMMPPDSDKFPADLHERFRQASRVYSERRGEAATPMYYDAPSIPIPANVFISMDERAYERADKAMEQHLTQTDRTDYRKVLEHLLRFWREVGKAAGKFTGKEWYATPFVVTDKNGQRIDPSILKNRRAKTPMIVMIPHQDDSELSAIARILERLDQADEGEVAVEIWAMGPGNGGVPTITDDMIMKAIPIFRRMYGDEDVFVARFGERFGRNQKILAELQELADDVQGFIKKHEGEYKDFPEILSKLKALDKASIEKVIASQRDKLQLFKDPRVTYKRMLLAASGEIPTGQELEELREVVRYVIRYPKLENAQKVLQSKIDGYKPNGSIVVRKLSSDLLTYSSSIPRVPSLNALFAGFADETASMLDEFCRDYEAEIIYDQAHGVPIEIVGPHQRDAHANHVATADAMTAALPIFAERHPELNYEPWRYLAVWAGDPPGTKNIYVACPAEWNQEEISASPWEKAAWHFSMLLSPLVGELAASRFGLKSQDTSAFVINRLFAEAGAIEPPPALIASPVTVAPVARKKLTVEKTQKRALVTGGAGYLGSILTRYLMTQGVDVWVIDDESTGHAQAVPEEIVASGRYVKGDINDTAQLTKMIRDNNIDVVYHLAAKTLMGDSVETPALYSYTNAIGTLSVAEAIKTAQEKTGRRVVLFNTSTCGVFDDEAIELKQGKGLSEKSSVRPTAPYTETKLTAERILEHYQREYDVEYVSIRPFNIVGAHQTPDGQWWGEDTGHATHLITVAGNVVTGKRAAQGIFGNDFDTSSSPAEAKLSPERMADFGVDRDGTGIREYIHADDICELGFAYVNYVLRCVNSEEPVTERVLGGGTGIPLSALKVLGDYVFPIAIELGIRADNPPTIIEPRRDGDDATKTLDTTLQKSLLGIEAQGSIGYIVRSHLMFITTRPNGYEDDKSGYGDISEKEALEKTMRALEAATNLSEDVKKDLKYRLMTDLVIAAITCSGPLDADTLMARKNQRKAMQVTRGNLLRDKQFDAAINDDAMLDEFARSVGMVDNIETLKLALKVSVDLGLGEYSEILRSKFALGIFEASSQAGAAMPAEADEIRVLVEKARHEDLGDIKVSIRRGDKILYADPKSGILEIVELSTDPKAIDDPNIRLHLLSYRQDPKMKVIVQSNPAVVAELMAEGKTLPALTPDFIALLQQKEGLIPTSLMGWELEDLLAQELRAAPKQPMKPGDTVVTLIGNSAVLSAHAGVFTAGTNALEAYYRNKLIMDTTKTFRAAEKLSDGDVEHISEAEALKLLSSKFEIRRSAMMAGLAVDKRDEEAELETVELTYDATALARLRDELVATGRKIAEEGLVVGPGGNISACLMGADAGGRQVKIMLIKASGKSFENMGPEDYIGVTVEKGKMRRVNGLAPAALKPSTEVHSHRAIYLARTDVSAVVHAHSPIATGIATAGVTFKLRGKDVPLLSYVYPGVGKMPKAVAGCMKDRDLLIIRNHGPITVGGDLKEALGLTLEMESEAKDRATQAGNAAAGRGEEMVTVDGFRIPARIMNAFDERKVRAIGTIVGVPTEIKPQAERVGLTPKGVNILVKNGVRVIVQRGAGRHHFSDAEYQEVGAELVDTAEEVWSRATIIKKVKEPLESELGLMRPGQIIFTYLHLASPEMKELTGKLVERHITGIAYETVLDENGDTSLLKPMSIIAGDLGGSYAAIYANENYVAHVVGDKIELSEDGVHAMSLMKSKYPKADPDGIAEGKNAVILGGGISGERMAARLLMHGASVTVTDTNEEKLAKLRVIFAQYGDRFKAINPESNINAPSTELFEIYAASDILGGCISVKGGVAPKMSEELLRRISKDHPKVIVDIALDQGGNFYGSYSRHYSDPVFLDEFQNIRFCVPNMPDAEGKIASVELEKTNIAYTLALAMGLDEALEICPELRGGINTHAGAITHDMIIPEYPELPHKTLDAALSDTKAKAAPETPLSSGPAASQPQSEEHPYVTTIGKFKPSSSKAKAKSDVEMATGELEEIFKSTDLLRREEPIEIFVQKFIGINDMTRKAIADVNLRYKNGGGTAENIIICHIFENEGALARLLRNPASGRRIVITAGDQFRADKFSADERGFGPKGIFKKTRFINVALPDNYGAVKQASKTFYQAWAANIAIYGRMIEYDSPIYLRNTFENMLEGSVDGPVGNFIDDLIRPEGDWRSPGERVDHFLGIMVRLSRQVAKDYELLKLRMKAFWTAA